MALAVAMPTRIPVTGRAHVDGDGAELAQRDIGLPAHELDGRRQRLRAVARGDLEQPEHARGRERRS
jgi:hypothetical protein